MKKFIPILSLVTCTVFLQNCVQRDEDVTSDRVTSEIVSNNATMRNDSARSGQILDPDPPDEPDEPVRDGDNWRQINKNNK
ncbi:MULTISPECIES: hypothetical protein [Chryseobacterium]|uniref:Lipoprotein n=1 Tax=Chryseobacterium balustinum TaxID=246 RepID=A0AAX2IMT4_9FLAO|nr:MULTISPECIES: hypothetical protein [Chryseobacterium]AZB30265.1 hypothetical protein EB354_13945 [Chryseobacterium balustinum]OBW43553.1 hypothetical protein AB670_00083 [Chryseobacterium sp. MOF25P]OBW46673.1 hypothetical protein AB671_01168 [Chryseobacterium sp. BGARF1]SKC03497.1 hypothetical protein SAMN05421800_12257 [Chryseobacterium balustinum]SQA90900.1 Uncharacterised protein [Chryseobacterium balustinum]